MKKIILALTLLTAAVFASCSKDDTLTDALTGTTWASSYEGIPLEISFEKGGKATLNMGSERYVGTYTYNQPNVTIQMPIEGQNVTFNGTYSNGSLHISNSEYGTFVFTQTSGPSPDDNSGNSDGPQGHTGKLVKKITVTFNDEQSYITTFEYDAQNRVTQIIDEHEEYHRIKIITITYNGNTIKVTDSENPYHTFTATLNSEGYIIAETYTYGSRKKAQGTYTYDDNGMLQSAHIIKEENDDYKKEETVTYTWNDGNLVAAMSSYTAFEIDFGEDKGSNSYTYTYDTSVKLADTNLDLIYLFLEIVPEPIGQDGFHQLGSVGNFYGKSSKNPLIKVTKTRDDKPSTLTFTSYAYNADGTVAAVHDIEEYESFKYHIEYYK